MLQRTLTGPGSGGVNGMCKALHEHDSSGSAAVLCWQTRYLQCPATAKQAKAKVEAINNVHLSTPTDITRMRSAQAYQPQVQPKAQTRRFATLTLTKSGHRNPTTARLENRFWLVGAILHRHYSRSRAIKGQH
uniref:Uncharacterized protein n=1 Tax=Anopheles merus TaxID=30066 RepID=A0A182VLM4_ANOME